jgi:acyl-CoA dehydrogenase
VEIAMIKYYGAGVLYNVIDRAIQVHGALGFSTDLPLESMYRARPGGPHLRRARRGAQGDRGPPDLKGYKPAEVPTEHVPTRRAEASSPTCWRT